MSEPSGAAGAPTPQADAFFVQRDCRELFQRRLEEIARQAGVSAPAIIDALTREIALAHDELAAATQHDGFEQTDGLTASRISLVGHDDLELDIRIGDIATRLKGNERIDRWRVQLRYMTLLNRPKMTADSNPLGLEPICRGLWAICRESGLNLEKTLDRLERLEEQLQLRLPELYIELNDLLERYHVEPAQVRVIQRGGSGSSVRSAPSPGDGSHGQGSPAPTGNTAISSLQNALRQQAGDDGAAAPGGGSGVSGGASIMLNASTLTMLNHLMDRLSALEQQQLTGLNNALAASEAAQEPLRAIKSKDIAQDIGLPLGKPATIALDTLSLIFESIFASPDLPDVVKTAISRLQIPLLKLAILDASFFADTQHPARRLINRMARAALGLAQETGRDHPVCLGLSRIADATRRALESADGDLAPHLDALETLINERDQAQQGASRPYAELVCQHEARQGARGIAQGWLQQTFVKTAEPAIRTFLADYWQRVMQDAAIDGGVTGRRWKDAATAIDELLWSVTPKQSPDERKKLVALVPTLIQRINAALDRLAIPNAERTPFLNACFDLQTAALRNRQENACAPPANTAGPGETLSYDRLVTPAMKVPSAATQTAEILEQDGKLVHYLGQPATAQTSWRNNNRLCKVGDWLRFQLPEGETLCGRHCGQPGEHDEKQPSGSDTLLLFNTDWGYAVALASSQLEQQLRNGQARIVSDLSLFDEAAEKALSRLVPR